MSKNARKQKLLLASFVGVTVAAQLLLANTIGQMIWHITGIETVGSIVFAMIAVYVLYFAMRLLFWRLTEKGIAGWVLYRPQDEQPKQPTTQHPELVEYMVNSHRYR
jgi:chromate transport protein ChrA